ncbi:stage V sporulation protein AD [Oxobacter pfennigii]|uniref:Stage V sporulation protein AD n=1 Tax=Oxobacter pfennigii TaxID=36849 RepID=A0A0P8X3I2_9CLOT|nr:stage V sporulation protein AD [Oxobacter pfennigii]KPU45343.1 stage V sporulation protein AD [Oxobacter pfennigii]
MALKKLGKQTVKFINPPSIISTASIVGPKEGEGPLAKYFDTILGDDLCGQKSYEKAECCIFKDAANLAIEKAGLKKDMLDYMLGGDLLNQIITASFAARDIGVPFFGLYGACSTMSESLSLGSMLIDGGYADYILCITSSHFSSAERQYRFPLELGTQRTPTAQWTVTGSGGAVISTMGNGPYITHVTTGKVIDFGIKDANNMGAAMAPAAADTISQHFKDTGFSTKDYDVIATGDLGSLGMELTDDLLKKEGFNISDIYTDCGVEIFDSKKQDTHAGGSGCGCSAVVFSGYFYEMLKQGKYNRIMLVSTGALLSPTSTQQGESIPGIAHAVTIERMV